MGRKPTAPTTITPTADARQQVKGVWIEMSADYLDLSQRSEQTLLRNTESYPKARHMYELLQADPRMKAHWNMANYIAVVKLGFNDHGPVHAQVATAAASTITSLEPYITVRAMAIDQSANGHIITGSVELRDRAFHVVAP